MSIEGSAFVDLAHLSERSASRQLAQSDATLTGVVSAVVDAERGLVEVQIDGSDDLPVVASADAGLTYVGARVSLPRDSSGRVVGVKAPAGVAPQGVEVVPVGEEARRILASEEAISLMRDAAVEYETVQGQLSEKLSSAQEAMQAAEEAASLAKELSAQAVEDASSAVVLRIDSSRGLVFKNSQIGTVLSVTVFARGRTITDIVSLREALGVSAFLEWSWKRMDDSDFGLIASDDARISRGGFELAVSAADVDAKTVFMCSVNV